MGFTLSAALKPLYNANPDTVADLQGAVDYAERVGGTLRGTSTQRNNLTASEVAVGVLFVETDTDTIYQRTTAGWRMVSRPPIFFKLARTTAFEFPTEFTDMTWDPPGPSLAGFTTVDNKAFVCTVPGVYNVLAILLVHGGSAPTSVQVQVRRNGSPVYFKLDATSGVPSVWRSLECGGPVPFQVGDVLTVARFAQGATVTGQPGTVTSLSVDYLHP